MQSNPPSRRSVPLRAWDWLDERYRLQVLWHAMVEVPIPRRAQTYFLGGITLFLFGVQAITGILLAVYYQPTPERAYDSILFIMNDVAFGWLIRSIHAWGANLMIIFCVLHLLRVFLQAAYKAPRELTWVAGMFLLLVTLGFGFTGYLLPWDQRAFWATVVGSNIADAVPFIGDQALIFLRSGPEITALTLTRFFAAHVLILPASLGALLVLHLVMVHQQGLADPTEPKSSPRPVLPDESQSVASTAEANDGTTPAERKWLPFFPNYVLDEVIAWYILLGLIVVLASLLPVGLEEQADPFKTPPHVKPEWYFLAVYQLLKLVPRTLGVLAPMVGIAILIFFPFLDRNPYRFWRRRPLSMIGTVIIVALLVWFSIWGYVS